MQLDHSYSKNFAEEGNNSAPVPEETIVVSEEDSELGMHLRTDHSWIYMLYLFNGFRLSDDNGVPSFLLGVKIWRKCSARGSGGCYQEGHPLHSHKNVS